MCGELIVTTRDVRQFLADPGNPHMIWHGGEVRVVSQRAYNDFYRHDSAVLISSRAGLAAMDPGALEIDPVPLATMLTTSVSPPVCPYS